MPRFYRIAVQGNVRLSPLWEGEAAVFNPALAQIFVVTESAARLLAAIQHHPAPASVADLVAQLRSEPRFHAPSGLEDEVESMLIELEHLGFVESTCP